MWFAGRLREKRSNDTHQSTTDPDARLATKGPGQEAKLFFMGHVLMENRNGLAVGARLTHATGRAEREAAMAIRWHLGGTELPDTAKLLSSPSAAQGSATISDH